MPTLRIKQISLFCVLSIFAWPGSFVLFRWPSVCCISRYIQKNYRSIWSVIQLASHLCPPCSVANIFGNWLHGIDHRFRMLIRVGAIAVIWSLWLCRIDKVFNDENSFYCKLSTSALILSVHGRIYSMWRIGTYL
jgi:hypothetical protein